jgi:release factor glutamine methyltransferase
VEQVAKHVARARERLRGAGVPDEEADLDARLLAQHALGWTTEQFFTDFTLPEPAGFSDRFDSLVDRRAAREPFAYIVGHEEFWGLQIEVTPAVLIPRPETELLVELAIRECSPASRALVADVCTGSGCVAVAIAHDRPMVHITATDVSAAALDVARRNADRHTGGDRVDFVRTDLLDGLDPMFDVIVANPPYVPERDRPTLQPEVVEHEPALALFAGDDGLDVIRRLLPQAAMRLKTDGTLLFEFGFGQADAVARLISSAAGLKMIELRPDLQGIPRAAVAKKL